MADDVLSKVEDVDAWPSLAALDSVQENSLLCTGFSEDLLKQLFMVKRLRRLCHSQSLTRLRQHVVKPSTAKKRLGWKETLFTKGSVTCHQIVQSAGAKKKHHE